ncbi:unnamed protein product, partial [Closterium sp. NIES-54]
QPAHPPVSGLGAIATFTTYELLPYRSLVFYTVILSVVALDGVAVEQKCVLLFSPFPHRPPSCPLPPTPVTPGHRRPGDPNSNRSDSPLPGSTP